MNRIERRAGLGAAFVIVAALAYVLGVEAANYFNDNDEQEPDRAVQMENKTADLHYRMGTIKVGDTLTNYAMEDIDGQLHLLKEIVTDRTVLAYIKPGCGACQIEFDQIRKAVEKGEPDRSLYLYFNLQPAALTENAPRVRAHQYNTV